jgi:hypothetical protein
MRLTDYSGGTAADFHGLSFSPALQNGAPQEQVLSEQQQRMGN